MGKLIIDDTPEHFTRSTCPCDFCKQMNDETNIIAQNNVQSRLLEAVKRIEAREKAVPITIPPRKNEGNNVEENNLPWRSWQKK